MKKMRLVHALALAGLTVLNAHADPVAQEVGGFESGVEVMTPVPDFVAPTESLQPEINVISPMAADLQFGDSYWICACVTMVSVDDGEFFMEVDPDSAAVPEPATLPLLGLGLAGILAMRRKRQR